MDTFFEGVDNINPYTGSDRVNPSDRSERDKERKFARELEEKLKEDLEKRKKRQQEDELIIDGEDKQEQSAAGGAGTEEQKDGKGDDAADADGDETQSPGDHVDLTA